MGKKRKSASQEVAAEEQGNANLSDSVAGEFNERRELYDLGGQKLTRTKASATVNQALTLIKGGASAAFEVCGCGGWAGCQPIWLADAELEHLRTGSKPRRVKSGVDTWIDVWSGEGSTLVFAHGDIRWDSKPRT